MPVIRSAAVITEVEHDFPNPQAPDAISQGWLTRALRDAGVLNRADVVTIDVTPVAAVTGLCPCTASPSWPLA